MKKKTLSLAEAAQQGIALTEDFVVDCHMHNGRVAKFFSHFSDYDDLIAQMDTIGISAGIVSNLWETGEHWQAYREIMEMCTRFPGRFYAYTAPNPNERDFRAQLEKYAAEPVCKGIKLHPFMHKKEFLCAEYRDAYAVAAEHCFPVLLHTWGTQEILQFDRIAQEYPRTTFLLGHSGGEEDAVAAAISVAARNEHIYLDTACSFVWHGAIEAMVAGAGAEKILFGSDAYWNSMEAAVGRILMADISDDTKRRILGLNAKQLFKL